jgi:cell pole-organizing protein PopZ
MALDDDLFDPLPILPIAPRRKFSTKPPSVAPQRTSVVRSNVYSLAAPTEGFQLGPKAGKRTISDLAHELVLPMIKEWLDRNLPRLVERLVREELERLSGPKPA